MLLLIECSAFSIALVLIENAVCKIILLLIEYTALLLEFSVTIYRMCYY